MQEESRQETSGFSVKKKVDESWKNAVEKEKTTAFSRPAPGGQEQPEQEQTPPAPGKPDFLYFVSGLGMQVLAALGELPDEAGLSKPADLDQAKYLIDILEMLAVKTKGNLSREEKGTLDELLYQLHLKFVQKSQTV